MNSGRNHRGCCHSWKKKIPWATHESFSQNCSHSWTFFRRIVARCVYFTVHSWTMKPRLLMKSFHCILVMAARMQCRLDFVFLEQLTGTHAYSINKLFKNHTLPIVHSWTTHEPLMNHSWTVSIWPQGASGSWFLFLFIIYVWIASEWHMRRTSLRVLDEHWRSIGCPWVGDVDMCSRI